MHVVPAFSCPRARFPAHWIREPGFFPERPTAEWIQHTVLMPAPRDSDWYRRTQTRLEESLRAAPGAPLEVAIEAVFQIQNLRLYSAYHDQKRRMRAEMQIDLDTLSSSSSSSASSSSDWFAQNSIKRQLEVRDVFHGTYAGNMDSIIEHGLRYDLFTSKQAQLRGEHHFGVGNYVSSSALYVLNPINGYCRVPSSYASESCCSLFVGDCLPGWSRAVDPSLVREQTVSKVLDRPDAPGAQYHSTHNANPQGYTSRVRKEFVRSCEPQEVICLFRAEQVYLHTLVLLRRTRFAHGSLN